MKHILSILSTLLLFGCNNLISDEKFKGEWDINKVYYLKEANISQRLVLPALLLDKDHSCFLPVSLPMLGDSIYNKGTWSVYVKDDLMYINIKSKNHIFNKSFQIISYENAQEISYGHQSKMTLLSDSLKIVFTKTTY